jgi:solute carrier family 45 protein 1/2/4
MEGDGKEAAGKGLDWVAMNLEGGGGGAEKGDGNATRRPGMGIVRLFLACMVSGGIQYGWALQLSLLSPYSQVSETHARTSSPSLVFPFSEFALPHR